MTMFLASEGIAKLASDSSARSDPLLQFEQITREEVARILLYVAITIRVMDDGMSRIMDLLVDKCGLLRSDLGKPNHVVDLDIRSACNKIIHARAIDIDEVSLENGATVFRPLIYLIGTSNSGSEWQADLDVIRFCRECASILQATSR
jgi:hypothetical protein